MSYVSIFNLFPTVLQRTLHIVKLVLTSIVKKGGRLFGKKGINVSVLLAQTKKKIF